MAQQYLPDAIKDVKYYTFGDNKNEQAARAYWAKIKGRRKRLNKTFCMRRKQRRSYAIFQTARAGHADRTGPVRPPTAEEIYDAAVKECPGLSLGTVYRNLNSLVEAGRVRRVSIPGKADRFDHTLPWHSHLYCTVCGSVTDAEVDEEQVMKLVRNQKGCVQDCAVVLIGVCEACCEAQMQENMQ